MKKIFILISLFQFIFIFKISSQEVRLPDNPKVGKCYAIYKKEGIKKEWKEVDCELRKLKQTRTNNFTV